MDLMLCGKEIWKYIWHSSDAADVASDLSTTIEAATQFRIWLLADILMYFALLYSPSLCKMCELGEVKKSLRRLKGMFRVENALKFSTAHINQAW